MELAFANKPLRQTCESESIARRDLGVRIAEKLKRRLADLRAAKSVTDLVAGRPRELEGSDGEHYAVELRDGSRIVFCANHVTIPVLESGSVDWSKVNRVKILRIESNHG